MSHLEERKEQVCLNCNAELHGRYCHLCGQENLEPKESFWHLVTHFVYDVTHFDGKFFSTLKYLLFKPGFLPLEYSKGRRMRYLHPIRMYVFTSAIFFVIFLTFIARPDDINKSVHTRSEKSLNTVKQAFIDTFYATTDSDKRAGMIAALNAVGGINGEEVRMDTTHHDSITSYRYIYADTGRGRQKIFKSFEDSVKEENDYNQQTAGTWNLNINDEKLPSSVEAYDSAQAKLPPGKRDGWFSNMFKKKMIETAQKWHKDKEGFKKELTENFLHSIPKMMFISVPFVALFMQLLYVRRRKQFYYVNHVIFITYVYIETFICLLVYYGLQALYNGLNFAPFNWLAIGVLIYIYLYPLIAMHNFYRQGYIKSFFKYLILFFVCSIFTGLLVSIFFITSLIEI
ncbi:MAG TPA: DUF3667 domain-containing protein [Chitinophagaceae bacterium]|nr:DUF3667 domain-containing protein [Chitinophagaceae bacterium]